MARHGKVDFVWIATPLQSTEVYRLESRPAVAKNARGHLVVRHQCPLIKTFFYRVISRQESM